MPRGTAAAAHHLDEGDVRVTVEPFGPTTQDLEAVGRRVATHRALRGRLADGRARLLYVEALDDEGQEKATRPSPPSRFRATVWDAERGCTVLAEGDLSDAGRLALTERATAPPPAREEFDEAVRLVSGDEEVGQGIREGRRVAYQPIPALDVEERADGSLRRRIAVGLIPRGRGERHEIVAVDLGARQVHRSEQARAGARPATGVCGVPVDAGQASASKGTAGQVLLTVTQGSRRVWRFFATRPAASTGTNGSGVELHHVDYRGKRVLTRAHVPILNVKYDGDACGPYRDWQYQEGMIQAQGVDVAPGFRLGTTPAKTIMETGSDTGTFLGVGVSLHHGEVELVSEMEAGWYRYISRWRLGLDGVIRPRFGFAATESECVCNVHHHHAYWRFDFDIRTAAHNRVREFNDPPPAGGGAWHVTAFETYRRRDPAQSRRWLVENSRTGEGYEIRPGADDGVAATEPDAPFGRGDVWILRYRPNQVDDGSVATGPPYEAGIGAWLNGEPVSDHDVVLWYGAHFTHDVHEVGPAEHGHIVGPDLHPVGW
jgi:hypothetical protein